MHVLQAYGYYASGSESESTLRDNEASFKRYMLVPRLMVDVSKVDTTVKLLGESLACSELHGTHPGRRHWLEIGLLYTVTPHDLFASQAALVTITRTKGLLPHNTCCMTLASIG